MRDNGFGQELLSREQCLELLSGTNIGRIGFHFAVLPVILPVKYAIDEGGIVVRVRAGSQLDAGTRDAVVAFEADDLDPSRGSGWSVAVTGMATTIIDGAQLARVRDLLAVDWMDESPETFIRISLDVISGRRSARADAAGATQDPVQ